MPTTPSERAASANRSASRPVMATRAPACFNTSAAARPMPLDPPVIRTTAFLRSMFLYYGRLDNRSPYESQHRSHLDHALRQSAASHGFTGFDEGEDKRAALRCERVRCAS